VSVLYSIRYEKIEQFVSVLFAMKNRTIRGNST